MTEQLALLAPPPEPEPKQRELTDRQRLAYDYVCATPGGVTADEVGAWLHAHRHAEQRPHRTSERCLHCARDGRRVLTSVAVEPLVVRRRGGKYEPRNSSRKETTA
jgi:hypothetical protein